MQQRYYDSLAGRFLSLDPKVSDVESAKSFNRYSYANGSPLKFVDPDGRNPALAARIVFAASYEAASAAGAAALGSALGIGLYNVLHQESDESKLSDATDESKTREKAKDRRERERREAKEAKHGDQDEPASEQFVRWRARDLEKRAEKEGKDGKEERRKAHDEKKRGEPDRSKEQVNEDYKKSE